MNTPTVEQVAQVYVARRDKIAALEKEIKAFKEKQEATEKWFAVRMKEVGCDSFKTEFGTIYSYRSESVTVAEWDTFVDTTLIAPVADALTALIPEVAPPELVGLLKTALPLHLLNRAANKTACLELMGEYEDKTKGRPNPPPAGINYTAIQKVGVRKS